MPEKNDRTTRNDARQPLESGRREYVELSDRDSPSPEITCERMETRHFANREQLGSPSRGVDRQGGAIRWRVPERPHDSACDLKSRVDCWSETIEIDVLHSPKLGARIARYFESCRWLANLRQWYAQEPRNADLQFRQETGIRRGFWPPVGQHRFPDEGS